MGYLGFIVRVTSYIPLKNRVMIRFYGLYSDTHTGKILWAEGDLSPPPIIKEEDHLCVWNVHPYSSATENVRN